MAESAGSDLEAQNQAEVDYINKQRPSLNDLQKIVRACYMVIAGNAIWLLIPLFGLLTGNNIQHIFETLVTAGLVLFISNNFIGKRWYYNADFAKGTVYEKHFANINNIGYRTFFSTLIGALVFLILAVFLSEALKTYAGWIVEILDIVLSGLFVVLAVWVLRLALKGLTLASKAQPFA